ncbi:MAG: ASCH domain-containing protein [Candidatus Pacearchaeota archaeon]|nr:ASCH domain-containing protein [Candidatus Pacearchaeota archaeon]
MKQIITHHRDKEPFENIKKGIKKMEFRLYDKKRQKIKLGQIIKIVSRENKKDFFFVKVIGLSRFKNFDDLYEVYADKIQQYEKDVLSRVYSKEDEKKYGILVIHFRLVDVKI